VLPGIDKKVAADLLESACEACPYSKATRGNIDVALKFV
jgi:organic hydroperoxide reductase OsmC/OhrA